MEAIQIVKTAQGLYSKGDSLFETSKYQEAIEAYERAVALFEKMGNIEQKLFCLTHIGRCYVELYDLEKAFPIIQDVLQKCLQLLGEEHKLSYLTYHNMGYYFYRANEYEKAIEIFEKEWMLIEQFHQKDRVRLVIVCDTIGLSYRESRLYDKALEFFEKGIVLVQEYNIEESKVASNLYGSLGSTYWELGDLNLSLFFLEKALHISLSTFGEKTRNSFVHYCNIAILYSDKGHYKKALLYHKKALKLCRVILGDKHPDTCRVYNNLGGFYHRINDYKTALNYHQKALSYRMELYGENHLDTAMSLLNIGELLFSIKDYSEGAKYFFRALDIFRLKRGEECEEVGSIYGNLGNYYIQAKNDASKSFFYYFKALKIKKKLFSETYFGILKTYTNIGNNYVKIKKYSKAISFFEKILAPKSLGKQHYLFAEAYLGLGKCALQQNQLEESLQYLQKALQAIVVHYSNNNPYHIPCIRQKNLGATILLNIFKTKAKVFFYEKMDARKCLAALMHCQVGIQLIEKTYVSFKTTESKLILADSTFEVLELGAEISYFLATQEISFESFSDEIAQINADTYPPMDFYYARNTLDCLKIAFEFSEKSKALLLLSNIKDSQAKLDAVIPQGLLQQEYELKVELNYLNKRIQQLKTKENEVDEKKILKLQSQYFDHHQAYQSLIQQFEQNYPQYYRLKYDIQTVSIEALQQNLSEEQLVISYFVGEKYIYLFGITQTRFAVLQEEKPQNFDQLIKDFNKGINRLLFKRYAQAAHRLYQTLITPIFQHFSFNNPTRIQQLVIIPHDILSTLPFEALLYSSPSKNNSIQYADLDYLLLYHDVVYHYSATLWSQGQKNITQQVVPEDSFVGFAPVYQEKSRQLLESQREKKNTKESIISTKHPKHPKHPKELAGMRSVRIGGKKYKALLYSEVEVNGIKAAFEAQQLPQSTFLHEQATKANFEAAVKGKKYVLIAAHGFYNKKQPDLSGIIFSPHELEQTEEAVLYVNDAYHLDLKQTDLVVLSACESGIGKLAKGEGIMAVNRGFLYSGANNVIFTLFKVYDAQSSQLTQALFRYILEGKKYAQALRLAKLELIQQSDADPKAWAGFVMIGG